MQIEPALVTASALQPAPIMMDGAFSGAKDSMRSLTGKEKTWQDEVEDMCPSLTFTQARRVCLSFAHRPRLRVPPPPRRLPRLCSHVCSVWSDRGSGGSASAAGWASCSASGCAAPSARTSLSFPVCLRLSRARGCLSSRWPSTGWARRAHVADVAGTRVLRYAVAAAVY